MQRFFSTLVLLVCALAGAQARDGGAQFALGACNVLYSDGDAEVVRTSAELFAADLSRVTGKASSASASVCRGRLVIVGTARNPDVRRLAPAELESLEGRWESYCLKIVRNPFPGVPQALVVAGSDARGAAYGLMDLSRDALGVSPWHWMCDVPVRHRDNPAVTVSGSPSREPSVRYRGIFINDEDIGLRLWAGLKDPAGDIGPATYEHVCELLLRLKANHLLPAMHNCTSPFYSFPDNPKVAAKYGIVVGTSHCEPLLFNNASEWHTDIDGEWNYEDNRDGVLRALDSRVSQAAAYENIYTVGMRGIHDHPMEADGEKKKAEITEQVIADQRIILEKHLGRPACEIPQAFTPYKEVLTTYDYGMKLPDDVTIVWPDDNFGHMKRVSSPLEQRRSGRSGVYYHVSFLGLPAPHLWFSTTSTTLMYEELMKAYRATADRIWIVNCGDIKCCELQTDFFLNLAFDVDAFDYDKAASYPVDFLCAIAGEQCRSDLEASMGAALELAASRRPDQMGWEWAMTDKRYREKAVDTDFSLANYDELSRRIADYDAAEEAADRVMAGVPDDAKAAMFELLAFPVRSAAAVNRAYLLAQKYHAWYYQGRVACAEVKAQVLEAQKDMTSAQQEYWTMLDGKWDHIVRFPKWNHFNDLKKMPKLPDAPEVGVDLGGELSPVASAPFGVQSHLPAFSSLAPASGIIEVYARSKAPSPWRASVSSPAILLSRSEGSVSAVDSIRVSIDWDSVGKGCRLSGFVCVEGDGVKEYVGVSAVKPSAEIAPGTYVESDGVVSMPAVGYSRLTGADGIDVRRLRGIGIEGGALLLGEPDGTLYDYRMPDKCPVAEYDFWCEGVGSVDVYVYLVPQFPLYKEMDFKIYNGSNTGIRYGVMIDDLAPRMEPEMNIVEFGENHKIPILHECFINKGTLCIDKPGMHTLKLMCGTQGAMFQKIVIDFGGMKRSWNGPPTTIAQ